MQRRRIPTDFKVLILMAIVLVVPFAITLRSISQPRALISDFAANPTPQGYTWSLSLFFVPVLVLASWVSLRKENPIQKKAFWITTLLIATGGVTLDVFFGLTFFTFVNHAATLGLTFWGWSFSSGWQKVIPIEEVGFYFLGIVAVLLVYIWGDEFWFGAYNIDDPPRKGHAKERRIVSFHPWSAGLGVLIFAAGWLYKEFGAHHWHDGFPGYFLFLTAVAITPSILFFRIANPFINWRAFSLAFLFILLVSLFWEATIAVPYQWWGYQPRQMLGLLINGFSGLPIEAVLLWIAVTWATVIVYETVYTVLYVYFPKRKGS